MFEAGLQSKKIDKWNPTDDLAKFVPQAQLSRSSFDVSFYRNILFYIGIHWVRFDAAKYNWTPINLPSWFPKNQTNKFAVACDGMKSVLEQAKPEIIYSPGSNDESDIAASDACASVASVIDEEVDQDRLRSEVAALVAITGNAFVVDGYDMSPMNGENTVQSLTCLTCQTTSQPHEMEKGCPKCGGRQLIPAMDKNGMPIEEKYPIGKMDSEVIAPFGLLFDMQCKYIENSEFLIVAKTYPIDRLKSMFPDFADTMGSGQPIGKTGLFYEQSLSYAVGTMGLGSSTFSTGAGQGPRGTLYRIIRKPCTELPYGGEALVVDETVVWKGECSTKDDEGTPFYPITHFGFKKVPGRVFYKTPADDLLAKQVQRNKIESLLQLGAERVSNPTWLLPSGIGIENITGEPGEKLVYNGHLGTKPERIQGVDMPNSLYRWLGIIDEDFSDLSATYDILLGKHPQGVDTLGGMQLLRDRGLARFQDALNSWGRGWTNVYRNRLMIWKQRVKDDRTLSVLGDNGKWEMKKFNASTISGSIDVRAEEGSTQPKSKAYSQMMASQLMQAGLLDGSDPLTRYKLLTTFDAADLASGLEADVKDAIKERESFLEFGMVRPREIVDNHEIHLAQHTKDAKSEDYFDKWTPQQQTEWIQHINWHFQVLMQRMQISRLQDPTFSRGQITNEALKEKSQIETETIKQKKGIEIESKKMLAEMKIHGGAVKSAGDELAAELKLHQGAAETASQELRREQVSEKQHNFPTGGLQSQ
jgi:ssDNA-binding Zn-finger/Zn-ribbon topoisomerase 1